MARQPPLHGGGTGSNPVGVIILEMCANGMQPVPKIGDPQGFEGSSPSVSASLRTARQTAEHNALPFVYWRTIYVKNASAPLPSCRYTCSTLLAVLYVIIIHTYVYFVNNYYTCTRRAPFKKIIYISCIKQGLLRIGKENKYGKRRYGRL